MSPLPASVSGARLSSRVGMAGTKPGFEWDVPEDRDVDAGDEARPHVEPPAPRPHDASVGGEDDAARVIYGEVCAICRDDVTRRGRIDACDHLFCLPCIKRWANIETKCPLCKARFSFIQPEDLVPPDPDARPSTRGAQRVELKRVYLPHKDQVYEGDGELPDGVDIEEVLCGRCGDGGDEDKLMLCDGCDQGYHCYCVGLDAVPLDEWRCQICADEDGDDGAEAQPASEQEDETAARDEAMARGLQRAEDAAAARAERDDLIAAARERAARLRNARNARRGGTTSGATAVRTVGSYRRTHAHDDDDEEEDANEEEDDSLRTMMTHRSRRLRAPARPAEPAYRAPNEDASRRVQIARVAELRQMWERYRTGAIGFSVPDAEVDDDDPVAAPIEPDPTEDNRTDDWELARRAAEHNPADGNRRRRGDPPAVRVAALGASTRELKRPASRRARGVNSVQLTSSSTPGDASPFSPVAASEWVNPPPPDAQRRRTNVDTRGTYQRRPGGRPRAYTLPAVVGSIGAAGGSRLPPGISFTPPRPDADVHDSPRRGWSDDSDDEPPAATAPSGSKPRQSRSPALPRGRHDVPATSFVPPGLVEHSQAAARSEAETRRIERETAERAKNLGAPDKKQVAGRARHFLRPAWCRGRLTKDQFKEYAKRATTAGFAAACALALKSKSRLEGMSEDDVLAGAEGRMREMNAVVDRAVTASLVKLGVEMETQ